MTRAYQTRAGSWLFIGFLFIVYPAFGWAADSPSALTVRESGVNLYAQQDPESQPIAKLQKGDMLIPIAESVGQGIWYLVRTPQGLTGWVRAADVSLGEQTKETFKEQQISSWNARTNAGRTFDGTWTVEPGSSADKASGTWTLNDGSGAVALRGTWSAQKFSTGWSGVWRATVEGKPGELVGSWTADLSLARNAPFSALFEAATRDLIRGVWSAGGNSGSWSLRGAR
jgi:Bacterial SH3 domain